MITGNRDLATLWIDFKRDGSQSDRNELVIAYGGLVRYVAGRVAIGLPATIEHSDLASYGTFGLFDAIEKFDLDKGVKFETYAISRIKGSIIDELRAIDWVPRSIRSKARDMERVLADLEVEFGRAPEDTEVAEHLGVSLQELWTLMSQASVASITGFEEHEESDERLSVSDFVYDMGADPEGLFETYEVQQIVSQAVAVLPERSKTILVLYYIEEMTLAEIGEVLGVTESRVCQLQSKLLQHLRDALQFRRSGLAA
jgi:RNA polymerase sigma factor for flagellar operon FliA